MESTDELEESPSRTDEARAETLVVKDAMGSGEDALREVERALEQGDLDAAERLLTDVERLNAAIRDVMGVDKPY